MTKRPMRAIIYARLSPTPRGEEAKGGNIDQQVELCKARCESEGWQVVETITEQDTSATSRKPRVGWERAVGLVRSGEADAIVARHYDRMYRKVSDLEELVRLAETTGVTLVAVESVNEVDLSTATGRANARFMAVGAALEGELKSERQKRGHQRRVQAGRPFWGTRPFGFEKDGSHRENEAHALRQAYSDLLAGHSLYGITQRWNAEGILTPKGNPWRSSNLRGVILHPRNAAIHTYTPRRADEVRAGQYTHPQASGYEATWEAIVSPDIFTAVATLLGNPERNTGGGGKRKGLLTYIAECGKCGSGMGQTWNPGVRKDGTRLRKYQCRECRGTSIPADFLDDYVVNRLALKAERVVAAKLAGPDGDAAMSDNEADALRAEQVSLTRKKEELAEDYVAGDIDRGAMRAGVKRADERLAAISEALTKAVVNRVSAERWRTDLEAMFYRLDQMTDPAQHDELREIIKDVIVSLKVLPRGKGKRDPGPEDVEITFIDGIEHDEDSPQVATRAEASDHLAAVWARAAEQPSEPTPGA